MNITPYIFTVVFFFLNIHCGVENVEADQMSTENGDFNNHRGVKLNFLHYPHPQANKRTRTYRKGKNV